METWLASELMAIISITILTALSPGPDFLIVSRNALVSGRIAGIATACGVGAGLVFHVAMALLGISALLKASALAFMIAKCIGAAYLIYLGIKSIWTASNDMPAASQAASSPAKAFLWGFVTNATNPKAVLFVLSLFLVIVSPTAGLGAKVGYGAFISLYHVVWFSAVALFFAKGSVRAKLLAAKKHIERIFGAALILFGGAILTTSATK